MRIAVAESELGPVVCEVGGTGGGASGSRGAGGGGTPGQAEGAEALRPLAPDAEAWAVLGFDAPDAEALSRLELGHKPRRLAPCRPGKIVAIGLNYMDHIREAGAETPSAPLIFAKFPSAVIGPGQAIEIRPELTERADWEVELAVIIGRRARDVSTAEALEYVFGYTVGNDVSGRDAQFSDGQWVRGKSFDTFCPIGPVVVTADEIADPQNLRLTTVVNGETVQDSNTSEMVFGVAELISYCSHSFTLEPGDLILTGTPWGCGEFMDPRRSLQDGDEVEVSAEGIGELRNPVIVVSHR